MKKYLLFVALCLSLPAYASPEVLVTVLPSKEIRMFPKNEAPASTIGLHHSQISAEIQGRILELPFEVGENVQKGQNIAVIDCEDYHLNQEQVTSEIEGAVAQRDLKKWQLERMKSLAQKNNASKEHVKSLSSELLKAAADLKALRVKLKMANRMIQKCEIKSPYTGFIVSRKADVGELVLPSSPILELLTSEHIEVQAHLHPQETESFTQAKHFQFVTQNQAYDVQLRVMVPAFDQKARTQEVRLRFLSKTPLPGSVGRLVWYSQHPHLPANLLTTVDKQLGFYIAENNKAKFIPIKDAIEGRPFKITPDFDEQIIIKGRFNVKPNDPISIQDRTSSLSPPFN